MTNAEIDRAVAEKVMGWELEDEYGIRYKDGAESWGNSPEYTVQKCSNYQRQGLGCELIKRPNLNGFAPSSNISDAWQVVEKMKASDWRVSIEDFNNRYRINFSAGTRWMHENNVEHINVPLGICLAALRALGVEVGDE